MVSSVDVRTDVGAIGNSTDRGRTRDPAGLSADRRGYPRPLPDALAGAGAFRDAPPGRAAALRRRSLSDWADGAGASRLGHRTRPPRRWPRGAGGEADRIPRASGD